MRAHRVTARRAAVWIAVIALAVAAQGSSARAAGEPAPAPAAAAPAAQGLKTAPFDATKAAAAAQIADPEAATRAYLDSVSPERRAQTKAYAAGHYAFQIVDFLFSALVMIWFLAGGLSVRFRNLARRVTRFRGLQTAVYWLQFYLVSTVIGFPLALYTGFFRERRFGLLTQDLGGFLADQGTAILLGCIVGAILISLLYGILRRAPRLWWVWLSGFAVVLVVLALAVTPVAIQPLFNKFTPVANAEVRTNILTMAHEHGIPADEVYEMDASRRTDRVSAYVAGLLGSMRIVMFDTTLKRCTPAEIQMIMGHEMGHYVLNHVWRAVAVLALVVVLAALFVRWAFARVVRRWPGLGIEGIADTAGLPLLSLLLSLVVFVMAPVFNSFSRLEEAQADDFGLDASRQPDAAATTFLKLGEYRDLEPDPIIEMLFFDHPSGKNRIRNAMEWKKAHPAGR